MKKQPKKKLRTPKYWMELTQEEINSLKEEDWEDYQKGKCLCFAHCEGECCCGSWGINRDNEGD